MSVKVLGTSNVAKENIRKEKIRRSKERQQKKLDEFKSRASSDVMKEQLAKLNLS